MKGIGCAVAIGACLALAAPVAAGELWRSDVVVSAPPTLDAFVPAPASGKPAAAVAFADDGDVVYGALAASTLDVEVVRVRADGSIRWHYALGASAVPQTITALLADADGGATFALADPLDDDRSNRIVHVDANGQTSWSRALPAGWLARLPSGRIASAGYTHLDVLDAASGDVVWQRTLSRVGNGAVGGLAIDATDLYVSSTLGDGSVRTRKYDGGGALQWEAATPGASGGVVAAGAGKVYVRTGPQLQALDAADGHAAWSSFAGGNGIVRLSGDAAAEPIVATAYSVSRLAAGDGSTRWSTPFADIRSVDVLGDALLVATSSARARLDIDSGAILWSVAYADGPRLPFGFGPGGAAQARALSRPIATAPGIARAIDERVDLANGAGAASVQVAAIEHGIDSASVLADDGHVLEAGASQQIDGPRLQLRAIDRASGVAPWQVDDAIAPPGGGFSASTRRARPAIAWASGVLAVAQVIGDTGRCSGSPGWVRIATYASANGARRWASWLRDADAAFCPYVSEPVVDDAGNVFASVVTLVACQGPSLGCQRRTLYKLGASDGAVLWRHDESVDAGMEGLVLEPRVLALSGADVVVPGGFLDAPATALRVSGVDGSVAWSSHVFDEHWPGDSLDRLGDGSFVAYGGDDTSYSWARLDPATGVATWTSAVPWVPCYGAGCSGYGTSLVLPGDDKLVPFQRDYAPWLKRQHNDGSGLVDEWMLGAASPILSSWVRQILRDSSGQLHAYLRRGHRFTGSVSFIAALDAQGNLLGQQAFYPYDGDPLDAWSYPEPLAMPAPDRILARTLAARPPLPTTSGVALFDTSVTARGNLAVALDTDRMRVGADMPLTFHLRVTYTGDAPIAGVRLVANLPWASGITGTTCVVQSGGACSLDTRTGNVRATFDLAPGGTVDVSGSVRVLDADRETPAITATTYGPIGLSESDTIDNFARVDLIQSLFVDGFDD
jgi:hypothetical protein